MPHRQTDSVGFYFRRRFMQNLPTLTTEETQRLRSDYPCIEHLEAGNVASG
jgi:hypothetical protein